jgi:hypothetical protein
MHNVQIDATPKMKRAMFYLTDAQPEIVTGSKTSLVYVSHLIVKRL